MDYDTVKTDRQLYTQTGEKSGIILACSTGKMGRQLSGPMAAKSGGKMGKGIGKMGLRMSGLVLKCGISTVSGTLNKTTAYKLQKASPMTNETDLYDALKYRVEVSVAGMRRYYNNSGRLHREEGPAVIGPNGECEWYRNGLRHRTDGPAFVSPIGVKEWYLHGKLHRTDGPAVIHEDGAKEWWIHGVQYTERAYRTQLKAQGYTA